MKRKLLCLLLSAVFVFSGIVMSACSTTAGTDTTGGEDGEKKKNDSTLVRSPMTLTLWVPTDENTTAESISDFEEKGKSDPFFAELDLICKKHNGLWNAEAEKYLLANAKKI